jgi:hypothetical protein
MTFGARWPKRMASVASTGMNMTATGVLFRKALMTATSRKVKKMVVRGRVEPRSAT